MGKLRSMTDVKALPSDVWFEILRRIPAVDLLPLKPVCKTFRQLICNDLFTRSQLEYFTNKHPKATRAIVTRDPTLSDSIYDPEIRTINVWHDEPRFYYQCPTWCIHGIDSPLRRHRVIESYQGLFLIQICYRLLLCNPVTRSHKFLPSICLIFGSCKIAYDDVLKQYKVFGLVTWPRKKVSLYVYDVRVDEEIHPARETTAMEIAGSRMDIIEESVLVNGSVHWLIIITKKTSLETMCIVSVNVTTEEVKTRTCSFAPLFYDKIFATNGTFYIGQSLYPDGFKIWGLEGVESENPNPSWMMKHCIETLTLNTLQHYETTRILGMFRCKVLIMIMRGRCAHRLCQYDLSSEEFEEITVVSDDYIGHGRRSFESFRVVEHVDSLINLGPVRLEEDCKVEQSISYPVFPWVLFRQLYCNMVLEIIPYGLLFLVAILCCWCYQFVSFG